MQSEIASNRKALHDYHILDRFEAGIELKGTEIKSVRSGHANIHDAFARVENGQVFLYGADILPYVRASHENHEAKRPRKLLLHKAEILKLHALTAIEGHTIVALRLYWIKSRVKVELGVAKGKVAHDKRQALKKRVVQRETDREISRFQRKNG